MADEGEGPDCVAAGVDGGPAGGCPDGAPGRSTVAAEGEGVDGASPGQ